MGIGHGTRRACVFGKRAFINSQKGRAKMSESAVGAKAADAEPGRWSSRIVNGSARP